MNPVSSPTPPAHPLLPRSAALQSLLLVAASLLLPYHSRGAIQSSPPPRPNILFILIDDLGYGEASYQYGALQPTPNIDRLASEGMIFTQHYAGSGVCAPSRCTLMTGLHAGHGQIRDNVAVGPDGLEIRPALGPGTDTVARVLQRAGYATGCIGKWGFGDEGTTGVPWQQGFDHFYGYLHNTQGTAYYTEFIYRNAEKIALQGNYGHWRKQYSPDLCLQEAYRFLDENKSGRFFLYYSFDLVHGAYVAPPAEPGDAEIVIPSGVPPTEKQRNYLSMIRRMDRDVGRLVARLDALGLRENTLVIVTSDNGHKDFNEGTVKDYKSSGGLRGGKADLYEGGIRIPFLARWPGTIAPKTSSDHVSAFWDFMPTACELTGQAVPRPCDGVSYLPTLLGRQQPEHDLLYWELAKRDEPMVVPQQAVRQGPWKLVRVGDNAPELYNLDQDRAESHDVAAANPEIRDRLARLMESQHTDDARFPLQSGPGYIE